MTARRESDYNVVSVSLEDKVKRKVNTYGGLLYAWLAVQAVGLVVSGSVIGWSTAWPALVVFAANTAISEAKIAAMNRENK